MSHKDYSIIMIPRKEVYDLIMDLSQEASCGRTHFQVVECIGHDDYVIVVCTYTPIARWKARKLFKQYAKKEDLPI